MSPLEKKKHTKRENEMCETGGAAQKAAGRSRRHPSLCLFRTQTFLFLLLLMFSLLPLVLCLTPSSFLSLPVSCISNALQPFPSPYLLPLCRVAQ